jgi:putative transposase
MARLPRLTLPGHPHHIIQRGNNRQPIFMGTADREAMLSLLDESARKFGVSVHAYVLMDNHFHLLATPKTVDGIPKWMQSVGRSYVRYFNDLHHRSGTLWEGRYRATLIQTERYLLACMAYIDLNPLRAGMVTQAIDFPWSSHAHYVGRRFDKWLTPHPLVWEMGNTPFAREAAYAALVQAGLGQASLSALTDATMQGWALGDPDFVANLQTQTARRVTKRAPGRPSALVTPGN